MDYLKRLESSVENFEAEVSKLTLIEKLISDTETLIDAVANEKVLLKKSVAQLENMQAQISKDCATLAEFTKSEAAARQKLLADIHKNILADSSSQLEKNFKELRAELGGIAEEIKSLKKILSTIKMAAYIAAGTGAAACVLYFLK